MAKGLLAMCPMMEEVVRGSVLFILLRLLTICMPINIL